MMEIRYLFHDCFLVRMPGLALVFDYWRDTDICSLQEWVNGLDRNTRLYFIVSHGHKDHYNPEIFRYGDVTESVHYIVSRDVYRRVRHIIAKTGRYAGPRISADQLTVLSEGEHYESDGLKVEAFGSTDTGNSYAIEYAGKKIFHAGDLNAWLWLDDSTPDEIETMKSAFLKIACEVKERYHEFDICFFPVDARLGRGYMLGAKWWLEMIRVHHFFAMHYELYADDEQKKTYFEAASDTADYASPQTGACYILTSGSTVRLP